MAILASGPGDAGGDPGSEPVLQLRGDDSCVSESDPVGIIFSKVVRGLPVPQSAKNNNNPTTLITLITLITPMT
jgi:hypothetical protein